MTHDDLIRKTKNAHLPIQNDILDDQELFKIQGSVKPNLKTFKFKLFNRLFVFETYTIREIHRITEPVDYCESGLIVKDICDFVSGAPERALNNKLYMENANNINDQFKENIINLQQNGNKL